MKLSNNFLSHFLRDTKLGWNHQWMYWFYLWLINLLSYNFHKINLERGDWIKNKKETRNPINNNDKYFQ